MDYISHIQQALDSLDWKRQPLNLYGPIAYALQSGGKRLRPQLVLMAADLFGQVNTDTTAAALAIEIFHNFTLLHDDVMDNAPTRRGRPTVHYRWDDNTAILSGDQMLIEAYKQISYISSKCQSEALSLLNKVATEVCEGQQMDMDLERLSYDKVDGETLGTYIEMIRLKTSVLLATALQLGALTVGAPSDDCSNLYDFGINLGISFQIEDDMLDVYGEEQVFGKTLGGDICAGKKTYLLLTALARADWKTRKQLLDLLHDDELAKEKKVKEVKAIYDSLSVRNVTGDAIKTYTQKALSALQKVNGKPQEKQQLISLALQLEQRQH